MKILNKIREFLGYYDTTEIQSYLKQNHNFNDYPNADEMKNKVSEYNKYQFISAEKPIMDYIIKNIEYRTSQGQSYYEIIGRKIQDLYKYFDLSRKTRSLTCGQRDILDEKIKKNLISLGYKITYEENSIIISWK